MASLQNVNSLFSNRGLRFTYARYELMGLSL